MKRMAAAVFACVLLLCCSVSAPARGASAGIEQSTTTCTQSVSESDRAGDNCCGSKTNFDFLVPATLLGAFVLFVVAIVLLSHFKGNSGR